MIVTSQSYLALNRKWDGEPSHIKYAFDFLLAISLAYIPNAGNCKYTIT